MSEADLVIAGIAAAYFGLVALCLWFLKKRMDNDEL